ncbi:MAG: hypothetical protein U1F09_12310 [Steroidobacteraceae bacterium]
MSLTWITNRSLKVSPRARLVADEEAAALRRKLESIEWRPEGGFLRDQTAARPRVPAPRSDAAA